MTLTVPEVRPMTTTAGVVAAVDLGASSGRVMMGRVGPNELSVHSVARFANDPVRTIDGLHWNILELYRQVLGGLRGAVREEPALKSAAARQAGCSADRRSDARA